jgi:ribosomal-protein-alanine N-acetyltransferase
MTASEPHLIVMTAPMIPVAAAIHQAAFGEEGWDIAALTELLAMPGAQGRIAIGADGHPLGFLLSLHISDTAELLTLAVDPMIRRHGIGTMLVRNFLANAKHTGATNAFLEVAEDNIPAISLYKREGFVSEGRRRDYYRRSGNIRVDAHVFRYPLAQI